MDIYTCGDPKQAELAYEYIKERLNPSRVDLVRLERGVEFENEEANIEIPKKRKEPVGVN